MDAFTLSPVPKAVLGPWFTLINVRSTAHDAYKEPKSLQLPALLLGSFCVLTLRQALCCGLVSIILLILTGSHFTVTQLCLGSAT